jgi:FMN phosphatase YigB (HAD superfamily)
MQVEFKHRSPIEKELGFSSWTKKEGIKRILLDLDDTICPTRPLFQWKIHDVCQFLYQQHPQKLPQHWKQEIQVITDQLFEKHGVNPDCWNLLVNELEKSNSISTYANNKILEMFNSIYTTPLSFLPEAENGLNFLKKTNQPIGIVTHANRDWTWAKYIWLGLDRFVGWDDVYVVDENGHKTAESWYQSINYFRLKPNQCVGVGDSPRSDINPLWSIGVRHCFLVDDSNLWSIHQQPVDPSVRLIKNLSQIPDKIF